ncbi:MAG: hypothetical protein U5L10_02510 [Candidatus Moranbacteria bacterium]|nr:hypothetical protein [Candidatus Moranbacteria bacterium]
MAKLPPNMVKGVSVHAKTEGTKRSAPIVPPGKLRRKVKKGVARTDKTYRNRIIVFWENYVYILNSKFNVVITIMTRREWEEQKSDSWIPVK